MSPQEFPHMSICGALHLSEGPPFGVPSEVYITNIPSYKTLLTHRSDHCPVLPPMPFRFPTSFHEQQSLLPASGRMLLGGGKMTNGCSILIQTTILDRCISHENYPNGNGYGKPTSHAISHTPPQQAMGTGPAQEAAYLDWVGDCLRISFEKEKVRFPPQEEYQYNKDLTNVAKPRAA